MTFDLRQHLRAWPFDPENPSKNMRKIVGADGRLVVQVREPLGIQQMEYDGRPDGEEPMGKPTWLEHYQDRAESEPGFMLTPEDCQTLIQEGILFYQRYLILYQMNDWEGVVRDTQRNLTYFDFLKRHADRDSWLMVEQYRPYVIRMNAISRSQMFWRDGEREAAVSILRRALKEIREMESVPTQVFEMESERSIKHLEQLIEEFDKRRPETALERLRREQVEAVRGEDFERAAKLRDQIRRLEGEAAEKV